MSEAARACRACGAPLGPWSFEVCARCLLRTAVDAADPASAPAPEFGPYTVIAKLGSGGMGTVYLAEHRETRSAVAIKVIREDLDGERVIERFRHEIEILGAMTHPCIARIYDAARLPDGRPFFVMEFADGVPIDRYVERHALVLRSRLELFLALCEGVAHAHQRGVIHRDLKPGNILVTTVDGRPVPKLIDFGIARVLGASARASATLGAPAGTVGFMSPEQTEAGAPVDTRADVYGLGCVLYLLLTGSTPFPADTLSALPIDEVFRRIRDLDPPRPSRRRPADARNLRGDLDAIVMKALAKDREDRYDGAIALADDLRRHLSAQPVRARPQSRRYRASRFVRRHRVGVAVSAGFATVLAAATVLLAIENARIRAEKERADERTEDAYDEAAFLSGVFAQADPRFGTPEVTARQALDIAADTVLKKFEGNDRTRGMILSTLGHLEITLGKYGRAITLLREADRVFARMPGRPEAARAEALYRLGSAENFLGDLDGARKDLERCLEIRTRVLGATTPGVAETIAALAENAWRRGDFRAAQPLYEKCLALRRRLLPDADPRIANTLRDLGDVAWNLRDYATAQAYYSEARDRYRRTVGPESPFLAILENNLGAMFIELRRWDDARPAVEEALVISEKRQGPNHPELADTLNCVARVALHDGEVDRAAALFSRALTLATNPSQVNDRASALDGLGAVALSRREWAQAAARLREALDAWGPPKDAAIERTETLLHLAELDVARGNPAAAKALFEEALAKRTDYFGPDHAQVAEARAGLSALR